MRNSTDLQTQIDAINAYLPKWSSTPPTESGWYWCRRKVNREVSVALTCKREEDYEPPITVWIAGMEYCIHGRELRDYEWWPIPLTAPGE